MSPSPPCCDAPDLGWQPRKHGDRFADVLICATCDHPHTTEDWSLCIPLPAAGLCLNCGATYDSSAGAPCGVCALTATETEDLHRKLAGLHPSSDCLQAARAAAHAGRHIMAFKLATSQLAYIGDTPEAREIRLAAFEQLGMIDQGLAEAWEWVGEGAPARALAAVAGLEAARGNLEGTVEALSQALAQDPASPQIWTEFAEIQAHLGVYDEALAAAEHGLAHEETRARCLEVIATVAEHHYERSALEPTHTAIHRAGKYKRQNLRISWLTARLAARLQQWDEARAWLKVTVQLDPNHSQALEALARLEPTASTERKGLRGWFTRSNPQNGE